MGYINSQIGETSQTTSETVGSPGPRGDIGPAGPQGPIGPQGQKGPQGPRVQKATKVNLGLRVVPTVLLILTCKISTIFCD